jgi:hypothetical protein
METGSRTGEDVGRIRKGPHGGAGLVPGKLLLVFTYKIRWIYFLEIHMKRKEDLIITL